MTTAAEKQAELDAKQRRERQLAARQAHPDSFVFVDDGDTLVGTVIDVDVAWSDVQNQNGRDGWYPLLTVKVQQAYDGGGEAIELYPAGKELIVHGLQSVLRNEILRNEPAPGETVHIAFVGMGEVKTAGRNAPALYKVRVMGRDPVSQAQKVYGQLKPTGRQAPTEPAPAAPVNGNGQQTGLEDDIPY